MTLSRRCLIACVGLSLFSSNLFAQSKLEYNRDIRPILSDNCFACHGPDSAARKADLRLDLRDEAVKSESLVPGMPEKSEVITRILSEDETDVMPPPKSKKKLTAAQKETLKRWVKEGAEYQPHWSFIAPQKVEPPKVRDESWVRGPIDRFVLAKLEQAGLKPAPEADRRTLARRLSLDLTGLPPNPADVENFVNDESVNAYEKYVDLLLKSPHWGEHRGRYWLDAARFADTHGIHFDNYREMWSYRDWVIQAFNKNMPFDQFTVEQLAGDLLPNKTLEQTIATGFNRCNITTNEGGAISEEYLVLYTRDRTETTSQVWLGLTTGCAVCHDHKFDPLSQKEFYELAAFFNNTTQGAMDGNIPNTPPILFVPKPEDRDKWEKITQQLAAAKKKSEARKAAAKGDFDQWLKGSANTAFEKLIPTEGLLFQANLTENAGNLFSVHVDGQARDYPLASGFEWVKAKDKDGVFTVRPGDSISIPEAGDFERTQPFSVSLWVKIPKRGNFGGLVSRMDDTNNYRGWDLWMENDRVGMHIINNWEEDAMKVVAKSPLQPNQWYQVTVTYDGTSKASGIRVFLNGKPEPVEVMRDQLKSTTKTTVPFKIGQRHTQSRVLGLAMKEVKLFGRQLSQTDAQHLAKAPKIQEILGKPTEKRTPAEANEVFDWWLVTFDAPYLDTIKEVEKFQQDEVAMRGKGTTAHVMQEKPEMPGAFVLNRGEYDRRKDPVKPSTPKILPKMADDLPKNRVGFAKWLLQPEHPLTARVTVNRFWQELYGTGIVKTSGDFGITGDLPSHPELLDYLANDFRDGNWDVKRFFKSLVMSSTYRQLATVTPEKLEKDPFNRLLSRGPRFRMDAEMIRDYALAASGILVPKIGGPSVKPYMPDGVWEAVAMIGSNTRDYKRDAGENLYRRSMYTFWKRSAPPASMEILNAPNRETCVVRRERTNTPLQALVTLNDVQFVEAARFLAEKTLKEGGTTVDAQIDYMAKRLLARPFRSEELAIVMENLKDLTADFQKQPEAAKKLITMGESKADPKLDAPTLAAWTMLANEILNLDEVLNK